LRAKIIGLVFYIALGVVALRPSITAPLHSPKIARLIAWGTAIAVFGYIVSVAITKSPLGALLWW